MIKFQFRYFISAVVLLFVEILIALFVDDDIIRPHIGDLLVVILIYCIIKSFLSLPVWFVAVSTLLFSYLVEVLQYFNIVNRLGLQNSKFARVIVGTNFSWIDMLAYTLGIAVVIGIESLVNNSRAKINE
ncbi:MAG: DUF2809 domain-containing protein [Dyadobacter sp.]